ncbi:PKD domain-containing protein [Thermococcus sp. 18S1]|uniref:choice-of-anchor L domain-containing protein n=1 Tax=Thermococcus sp. 18S1 TaxID=1638210 RepID=UPI00143B17FB|nr:choice-of-anchor L domain-containing protein [Thermococcus sp. 18S1]NJE30463.1 PKD domain-containing protein [Thermococcus sp. 18S1]
MMRKVVALAIVLLFLGSLVATPAFQGISFVTAVDVKNTRMESQQQLAQKLSKTSAEDVVSGVVDRDATKEALAILTEDSKSTLVSAEFLGVNAQILIATSPRQGFPTEGSAYLIISTGKAKDVLSGTAERFISTNLGGRTGIHPRLKNIPTFDVATLKITLKVPKNAKTLSFKWKFGTEEIPTYIHSQYMDYFRAYIVLPDGSKKDVTTLPNGEIPYVDTIVDYVNIPGGDSQSPTPPFPIPNDVALNAITTAGSKDEPFIPFISTIDVTPYQGQEITILFEIGDAGDGILDSAVFIDGLGFDIKSSPTMKIDFLYDPSEPTVGETVWFTAQIPDTLKDSDAKFIWDFGDGHTTETNIPSVEHLYEEGGRKYYVTLTVKAKENGQWKEVGQISKPIYVQSLSEQEQEIYEILRKIDQWFNSADKYISGSDLSGIVSDMFSVYLSQEDTVKGEHEEYLPRIPSSYLEDVKGISPKYRKFSENAPAPTITSSELRKLLEYLHEMKTTPIYINGIVLSKNANGEFSIKYPDKTVYIREITSKKIPELGYVVIYKSQYMNIPVDNIQKTITILVEPKLIFDKISNRVSSRVDLWFGASCMIIFGKEVCPDVKSVFKGDFDIHGGASIGVGILDKLGDLLQGKLSILSPIFELVMKIIKLANDFGISIPTEGNMGIEGGIELENLKMQKYYVRSWSSVQLADMGGETSCRVGVRADNPDIGQALLTFPVNLGQTLALVSTNIPVVNWLIYSTYVGMVTLIPGDWKYNLYAEGSISRNLVGKKYGLVSLGVDAEVGTSMRLVPVWDPRWNLNVHGGVIGKISAESPDIPLWSILNLKLYGEAELPILELEFGDPIKPNMPDIHPTFVSDQPIGSQSPYKGIALSFNITTDTPCNCTIMPLLVLNNTPVVALKKNLTLQKGSNIVTLTVPGQYVYLTYYNGQFNVGLIINNENGSLVYANFTLGTTKSYNYVDFEHVIPEFSIKYEPIDKDSDGLYDAIKFNITEKEGLTGITLRPVLTAPGWIVYLNATNLTTSNTYITELDGMYVRKLAGNFTFVFYVYNTTSGIYLGTHSKEITVNPSKFESAYPTIQSFEPVVVNNTPVLKFNVSVPQKSNLTITVRYQINNAMYESAQIYPNATSNTYIIVPLNKDVFIMHNTTTAKIISANLVSDGLTVDTVPINQALTFVFTPDARFLDINTGQINDTLLVSAYIVSYIDTNATAVALLTFGNNSVSSYKYLTLRSLVPTGILTVFNFTLENLTDEIRESNGTGQLSVILYDSSGNLLAIQTIPVIVSHEESTAKKVENNIPAETHINVIITLSHLWTAWFFNYYEEFNSLYTNATAMNVSNETLQRALELHHNATALILKAWHTDDINYIKEHLWEHVVFIPQVWNVRKAFLMEREAVNLLKKALNEYG